MPVWRVVLPSLKVTVPVGVPAPGDVGTTVAIKFTGEADKLGFTLEVRMVVVLAWLTCRNSALDVEPVKLVSPSYATVMLWLDPTANKEVV